MAAQGITLDQLAALPKTHEAVIPTDYLDQMGHMNVMWYTHLFGNAMGGLFELVGLNRTYMEENHAGTFALEAHIRYLSEVRVGQRITVRTRLIARSAKRFHTVHFMVNHHKEDLAATFETIGTHVDLNVRRSSPLPDAIGQRIDELVEQHAQLNWVAPLCGSMQV